MSCLVSGLVEDENLRSDGEINGRKEASPSTDRVEPETLVEVPEQRGDLGQAQSSAGPSQRCSQLCQGEAAVPCTKHKHKKRQRSGGTTDVAHRTSGHALASSVLKAIGDMPVEDVEGETIQPCVCSQCTKCSLMRAWMRNLRRLPCG